MEVSKYQMQQSVAVQRKSSGGQCLILSNLLLVKKQSILKHVQTICDYKHQAVQGESQVHGTGS